MAYFDDVVASHTRDCKDNSIRHHFQSECICPPEGVPEDSVAIHVDDMPYLNRLDRMVVESWGTIEGYIPSI